ncbi:unnamed protein product, partial [Phaeothamnion confervicola]
ADAAFRVVLEGEAGPAGYGQVAVPAGCCRWRCSCSHRRRRGCRAGGGTSSCRRRWPHDSKLRCRAIQDVVLFETVAVAAAGQTAAIAVAVTVATPSLVCSVVAAASVLSGIPSCRPLAARLCA